MLPVIAIVGQPNVGKSTLFNRLTRSRDAIISAYPGTTRDRQYGQVNFDDKRFIIIDTGGITDDHEAMNELIVKQAFQAIADADKVLFIIDGQTGLTSSDQQIAAQLRKTGKPIILAINKIEGQNTLTNVSDAYSLGMGTPIPIAALHGKGLHDLISALLPEDKLTVTATSPDLDQSIKLAIVGQPNAGKSTLINRMLGEERVIVSDTPGTTRDSIYIPLERFGQHYTLIDTAGVRKRGKINETPEKFSVVKTLQAIEGANVVVYIIDARKAVTEQDLKLLGFVLDAGKGLVIAANKWDNMSLEERDHTKNTIDRHLDFVKFARLHYISALHGSGVGNIFESVNEAYAAANKKLSTPTLTKLLALAQKTQSPPLVNGRRIKLRYAHAGGNNPPRIIIHGNQLPALPQSYKRFLAHFYQEKLNLHGTPVFIEFKTNENPYSIKKKS